MVSDRKPPAAERGPDTRRHAPENGSRPKGGVTENGSRPKVPGGVTKPCRRAAMQKNPRKDSLFAQKHLFLQAVNQQTQ